MTKTTESSWAGLRGFATAWAFMPIRWTVPDRRFGDAVNDYLGNLREDLEGAAEAYYGRVMWRRELISEICRSQNVEI